MLINSVVERKENSTFALMREFESSTEILVLVTKNELPQLNTEKMKVSVHHLIDYRCEMLDTETFVSKLLLLLYAIIISLWFYRNVVHYPSTMTSLHRLLSIPPVAKLVLMAVNYLLYTACPWRYLNLKIYLILFKILLNLVFESVLVGTFLLIAMGYKIAKSNVSIRNFVVMMTAMLANYMIVFILMIFNEFYAIGTILYTCLNIALLVYVAVVGFDIVDKLKGMRHFAENNQFPQRALFVKIQLMQRSVVLICAFFILEIFYHGVLHILDIPTSKWGDQMFY